MNLTEIFLAKRNGRRGAPAVLLLALLLTVVPSAAEALDIFTLWRQPDIPLTLTEGDWVDYRSQVMAGGRRTESALRVVCLDRAGGTDDDTLVLELLPLREVSPGVIEPIPGEGVKLRVSRSLLSRQGQLLDAVLRVVNWSEGQSQEMTAAELQADPLVSTSLMSDFQADTVERQDQTTRVVGDQQLLCDQFVFTSADTQSVALPAGNMRQISTIEISAAVNADVPFLGLAYAAERVRAESTLDPPSDRFRAPPPRIRVEIMELVGFGHGAVPRLPALD